MRDIPSTALVKEIRAGWNLGNSLEVYRESENGLNPSDYETYWGKNNNTYMGVFIWIIFNVVN